MEAPCGVARPALDQEFEGVVVPAADVRAAFMAVLRFGYAKLLSTEEYLTGEPL